MQACRSPRFYRTARSRTEIVQQEYLSAHSRFIFFYFYSTFGWYRSGNIGTISTNVSAACFEKIRFFFHLKHVNKRFAMSHSKSKKNAWPTILPILVPFCLSHTCNQNRLISNNLGEDVPNKKRLLSGNFIGKTSRSHDFQTSIKNTAWSTSNIDKKM